MQSFISLSDITPRLFGDRFPSTLQLKVVVECWGCCTLNRRPVGDHNCKCNKTTKQPPTFFSFCLFPFPVLFYSTMIEPWNGGRHFSSLISGSNESLMSDLSALKVVNYHFNDFSPLNEKLNLENKRFFFAVLLKIKKEKPKGFWFCSSILSLWRLISGILLCSDIVVAQFH